MAVGIFTTYVSTVDDIGTEIKDDLKQFSVQLLANEPQKSKFLQCFVNWLKSNCNQLFGQYGGDIVIKSVLDFISVSYYEMEQENNVHSGSSYCPTSPSLALHIRTKSALPEAYSFFAFPEDRYPEKDYLPKYSPVIPDPMHFICYVNDIMSFWKEQLAGEKFNFIHISRNSQGVSLEQTLRTMCCETIDVMQRIRALASCEDQMLEDLENLMHGYILFHLGTPRYKLGRLEIPAAKEATEYLRSASHGHGCQG